DAAGRGRRRRSGTVPEGYHGGVGWPAGADHPAAGDGRRCLGFPPQLRRNSMPITLTKKAEDKVKEILSDQPEPYAGLRIQVVGGGCSGFQYRMGFDKSFSDQNDAIFEFEGLKVFVDKTSLLYMDGAEVDYVEGLHGAGFKFNNPNVTGSCGCGSSFSV